MLKKKVKQDNKKIQVSNKNNDLPVDRENEQEGSGQCELVFYCCHKSLLQSLWFKTTQIYCLQF